MSGKGKGLYATDKDNAKQARKAAKRKSTGRLSEIEKAAINNKKKKDALRAAYLKENANAKKRKENKK